MRTFPLRSILLCACLTTMSLGLNSCFYDCGEDTEWGKRQFSRLEFLVVRDSGTTYVHFDLWAEGDFSRFDSISNNPPVLVRHEVRGLGDTLRFHLQFAEGYYSVPDDSVPLETYLKVATTREGATSPLPSMRVSWSCKDANKSAARRASFLDDGQEVACSLPAPYQIIQRIEVEHETGRKVIIGY